MAKSGLLLVILPAECLANHNKCHLHMEALTVSNKTACLIVKVRERAQNGHVELNYEYGLFGKEKPLQIVFIYLFSCCGMMSAKTGGIFLLYSVFYSKS